MIILPRLSLGDILPPPSMYHIPLSTILLISTDYTEQWAYNYD